jgi:hypothetical protein
MTRLCKINVIDNRKAELSFGDYYIIADAEIEFLGSKEPHQAVISYCDDGRSNIELAMQNRDSKQPYVLGDIKWRDGILSIDFDSEAWEESQTDEFSQNFLETEEREVEW